jgi:hypothetical protein
MVHDPPVDLREHDFAVPENYSPVSEADCCVLLLRKNNGAHVSVVCTQLSHHVPDLAFVVRELR